MSRRFPFSGLLLVVTLIMTGCGASAGRFQPAAGWDGLQRIAPAYPATVFAVFSDPHLYDAGLGVTGEAYQAYLRHDRKLLAESGLLMDAVLARIEAAPVDFVIVCGDLTKDGEEHNHRLAAEKLERLAARGKKVFVVPGNHDIANRDAVRYTGEVSEPVPTITGDRFAEIYRRFGYGAALAHDPASLSYIAEPVEGLWLLALDSCRWQEQGQREDPITAGALSPATRRWIESMLRQAKLSRKAVIAVAHHGVLEHYPHNGRFYGQYLVHDHQNVAAMLAAYGVELIFTGHFHAQDVTARHFGDWQRTLYDIETGSIVTAPCPYRIVRIGADQKAHIESRFITAIEGRETDFQAYAAEYVYQGTIRLADTALAKYGVTGQDRDRLAPQISRAYATHLRGDEARPQKMLNPAGCGWWTRLVVKFQRDLIEGWYTDLPPADNHLTIDLAPGPAAAP